MTPSAQAATIPTAAPAPAAVVAGTGLPKGRIPSLDGLRAISILAVIVGHAADTPGAPEALGVFQHAGNFGVKCFFAISGFLITTLLLKEHARSGAISIRAFYTRRFLRIFPALYFYIGAIGVAAAANLIALAPGDYLHALTFTVNYHHERGWYVNHLWSLSVEEQFYLLWPALLWLGGIARGVRTAVAAVFVVPVIRAVMWFWLGSSDSAMTREFQAVCDALALGCCLAVLYPRMGASVGYQRFAQSVWGLLLPMVGLMASGLAYGVSPGLFYVAGQSLAHVALVVLLERYVRNPNALGGYLLNNVPMNLIGVWSYSLYLWQEPFLNPESGAPLTAFPANLAFTFTFALASYYLIERPALRLKERFEVA